MKAIWTSKIVETTCYGYFKYYRYPIILSLYFCNHIMTFLSDKTNYFWFFRAKYEKARISPESNYGYFKKGCNGRTGKIVDQNFFHKKFKIMLKMCLSDLRTHPDWILDIWIMSWAYFSMVKVVLFRTYFSFSPTITHLHKLSVFGKT